MADSRQSTTEFTRLVDQNGLAKLFANRVRARILATLFYADEPLSVARIAEGAGVTRSTTIEALEQLKRFDVLEIERTDEDSGETGANATDAFEDATIAIADDDDELVAAIRRVAELSTERFYEE